MTNLIHNAYDQILIRHYWIHNKDINEYINSSRIYVDIFNLWGVYNSRQEMVILVDNILYME